MSISTISSNTNLYQPSNIQTISQQHRTYFQQLAQDLQSGNLSAAQQDFANLQQLLPSSSSGNSQTQTGQQENGQSSLVIDLSALGQALQSGDLSTAQQAFVKLQQDMQSVHKGHHHHHMAAASIKASSSDVNNSGSQTVGNDINITA